MLASLRVTSSAHCSRAWTLKHAQVTPGRSSARLAPGCTGGWRCRSASRDEFDAANMTADDAYEILGISSTNSFDEILQAKNRALAANDGNQDGVMKIETAYDLLFMQSMKRRMSGQVEVSSSVRFADVPSKKRVGGVQSAKPGQGTILTQLPGGGLTVATPQQNIVGVQAAVFGLAAVWALAQALLESPDAQASDAAGLQLSVAAVYAIYSFKENKRLSIGRSIALTAGTFLLGAILGGLVQNWLRVDIVPLGSFSSPGVFVSIWAIIGVWLGCTFLA